MKAPDPPNYTGMKWFDTSESSIDEFFDALEDLKEEDCNNDNEKAENEEPSRFQSLGESSVGESSQQIEDTVQGEMFPVNSYSSPLLLHVVPSDSTISEQEFSEQDRFQLEGNISAKPNRGTNTLDRGIETNGVDGGRSTFPTHSKVPLREDSSKKAVIHNFSTNIMGRSSCDAESEINGANNDNPAAPSKPAVPPTNVYSILLPICVTDSMSTKDKEETIETESDGGDIQTLNSLVDKLQATELSRPLKKEEKASINEENKRDGDGSNGDLAIDLQNENIQGNIPENLRTPPKIDCRHVMSNVQCDITSPLEVLYLFCPKTMDYTAHGGLHAESKNDASSPIRKSIIIDDGSPRDVPPLPLSENEQSDTCVRELNLDSDSSDDDSSSASGGKSMMTNKNTGRIHDMRGVTKHIDVGLSDALDTQYAFLPSKDQLESRRQMSCRADSNKIDEEEAIGIPLAAPASFDSGFTEESSAKTNEERKKGAGVKFGKSATKMAANVRKGVAGLKSSRQQKRNRKRTASADMLPRNAVHVRSSSRQKRSFHAISSNSDHLLHVKADSSFNPMLLIKTVPNAHKGPAWCASFSKNGQFLATGGEDGNVCIWAVSPKSKSMHRHGITANSQQQVIHKEVNPGSRGATDRISEAAIDDDGLSAYAPPLHFVGTGPELAKNLEIISSDPIQRFRDHTADVIDLSWSHTNFLLSASIDSSVRLYHFSKSGCLHLFKHANPVASVAFHPGDDRYFISGGIDKKLRLWDIADGQVKEWAQAPDVITAARFTPDGKYAVAGLFRGQVYFYDVKGLKYYTQIACRNRSGKHSKGRKVTGISFVRGERDDWLQAKRSAAPELKETSSNDNHATLTEKLSDSRKDLARRVSSAFRYGAARAEVLRYTEHMLVSTNDSRMRLYGLNDFQLVRKYKGHANYSMQIRARVSGSGSQIACGSESGYVFIWETLNKNRLKDGDGIHHTQIHDKAKSSNQFEASKADLPIVTDSVFFPSSSMNEALLSSDKVFPFSLGMDHVDDDMSSAAILTLDYDGCMRVFLRKSCIDNILDAVPRGAEIL